MWAYEIQPPRWSDTNLPPIDEAKKAEGAKVLQLAAQHASSYRMSILVRRRLDLLTVKRGIMTLTQRVPRPARFAFQVGAALGLAALVAIAVAHWLVVSAWGRIVEAVEQRDSAAFLSMLTADSAAVISETFARANAPNDDSNRIALERLLSGSGETSSRDVPPASAIKDIEFTLVSRATIYFEEPDGRETAVTMQWEGWSWKLDLLDSLGY